MLHIRRDELDFEPTDPAHFTGRVEVSRVAPVADGGAAAVSFEANARTYWHSHPRGQVLHVLSGRAVVGRPDGEHVVADAGDFVVAPPDELHWHGATTDGPMVHLSITSEGAEWTTREVDDDDYRDAAG